MNNDGVNSDSSSPPLRSNILSSFLRSRPRPAQPPPLTTDPELSNSSPHIPPTSPSLGPTRHRHGSPSAGATSNNNSTNNNNNAANTNGNGNNASNGTSSNVGLGNMLRRRRSGGNVTTPNTAVAPPASLPLTSNPSNSSANDAAGATAPAAATASTIHRIRLVPQLESRRSLRFDPINRTLKAGDPYLRIGRFTDRSGLGLASLANATTSSKLAFRSKVVSRAHAEIWVDQEGKFWIKDTKSSSGTFLNHVRLSLAGTESRAFPLRDGDVLQLGVDYQGGTEDIYKSVKIRVEIGRDWQRTPNAFNTNALKHFKAFANVPDGKPGAKTASGPGTGAKSMGLPDCCICLFPVSIRQALFLAPCSHTFHYKCVRPLILSHYPAFSCPLCRTFADLEEDVEVDLEEDVLAQMGGGTADGAAAAGTGSGDDEQAIAAAIEASRVGDAQPTGSALAGTGDAGDGTAMVAESASGAAQDEDMGSSADDHPQPRSLRRSGAPLSSHSQGAAAPGAYAGDDDDEDDDVLEVDAHVRIPRGGAHANEAGAETEVELEFGSLGASGSNGTRRRMAGLNSTMVNGSSTRPGTGAGTGAGGRAGIEEEADVEMGDGDMLVDLEGEEVVVVESITGPGEAGDKRKRIVRRA